MLCVVWHLELALVILKSVMILHFLFAKHLSVTILTFLRFNYSSHKDIVLKFCFKT